MVSDEMSCGVNGRDPAPTELVDGPADPVAPGLPPDPVVQAVDEQGDETRERDPGRGVHGAVETT